MADEKNRKRNDSAVPVLERERTLMEGGARLKARLESETAAHQRTVADKFLLSSIVESSEDSIVSINFDAIITSWNKIFWDCHWWSYSPEIQAQVRDACERAAGGEVVRYDVPVRMAGDSRMWIDFQVSPLRDTEGRITHLIPSAMEIEVRRAAVETLRASQDRFRAAANAVSDIIWTNNAEGEMEGEQHGWGAFTGQRRAEYEGHGWSDAVHPEDRQPTTDAMLGTNLDVTERNQAQAALIAAKEYAEAASRAKDDFLAALSHELRTPLSPLLMAATALASDPSLPANARQQRDMMRRNVEPEARLIDDLLDLTRISHGKLTIAPVTADIHELLHHTDEMIRSDGLGKRLQVVLKLDAARHHALADPERLQQVFWTLLRNAATLGSVPAPAASRENVSPQAPPARSLSLLIVEDHEASRMILAHFLSLSGHRITTAASVNDALTNYKAASFDVVISDLGLPDGSGIDLMVQIQSIRPVAAIALSGYGMEHDLKRSKEAGLSAHLVKPVKVDQLKLLLARLTARDSQEHV